MKLVSFWKLGWRIFLGMIGLSIASVMVTLAILNVSLNAIAQTVMQIFGIFFVYLTVYTVSWRDGYSEMNRVKCGYTTYNPWKGFYAGLLAIIPHTILWLIFVICRIANVDIAFTYRLINFNLLYFINFFVSPEFKMAEIPIMNYVCIGFYWLIMPLFTGVAFVLGYKRISIMEVLLFKKARK